MTMRLARCLWACKTQPRIPHIRFESPWEGVEYKSWPKLRKKTIEVLQSTSAHSTLQPRCVAPCFRFGWWSGHACGSAYRSFSIAARKSWLSTKPICKLRLISTASIMLRRWTKSTLFALALKTAQYFLPKRGQLIRVLYSEIGRLLSHLLNVTTQAMELARSLHRFGVLKNAKSWWCFMSAHQARACHAAYIRPGGVHQDLPASLSKISASFAIRSWKFVMILKGY